jgi:hypothetical protein
MHPKRPAEPVKEGGQRILQFPDGRKGVVQNTMQNTKNGSLETRNNVLKLPVGSCITYPAGLPKRKKHTS